MGFFKSFFASCLGSIVAIIVVIGVGFFAMVFVVNSGNKVVINNQSVLRLDLDAPVVEQAIEDPL
ncbi:MAG: hypothetical protein RIA63_07775, partial [Cyclobacteriaceae bacterium]